MSPRLLEGEVESSEPERDESPYVDALKDEINRLRDELRTARAEALQAKRRADAALSAIRGQLNPLYRALQMLFGELDAAGVEESASGSAPASARVSAVWENWKAKLPGYPAKMIEALLLHREMNAQQLAIAVGCRKERIYEAVVKMNKAGLLNKSGGRFSLKAL